MIKYLHTSLIFLLSISCFSQGRLILNNGGIVNISNNAFVVIDNPASNAITRNTSGHIISEGEFNRVKWNIGTTVGTYTVPFGIGAAEYLPVAFTTLPGSAGVAGSLTFAMYPVGSWLNTSNLPTGVTNFLNNYGLNNSAFAIDRFWRIEPANYTTKPALSNLQFTYRDPEWSVASNAILESNLIAQRYNTGTNEWDDYMPGTITNTINNTSTVAALPSAELFTWWTLVDNAFILPVELTAFNASCDENKVLISWQTASESNNDYFEIERSEDGINFIPIDKVYSQNSNSTQPLNYTSEDRNPLKGKTYYRLKQVDKNKNFSFSSLVVTECKTTSTAPLVSIFPNPASSVLTIDIKGITGTKSVVIYDITGREMTGVIKLSESENALENIDVSVLAKATYILRLDVNNNLYQVIKFIKN